MNEVVTARDSTSAAGLPERVSRRPIESAAISLIVGLGVMVFGRVSSTLPVLLLVAYFVLTSALFIGGASIWFTHRDPRRPRAPRPIQARLRRSPAEPPQTVNAIAHNCLICGRPLTNAASMRARVGSTCIKTYGPRYMMVANPAHEQWAMLIVQAETQRAKEQALLNSQHQSALIAFRQLTEAWQIGVGSPNGRVRRLRRGVGRRLILMHAFSVHLFFIGLLVGALAFG